MTRTIKTRLGNGTEPESESFTLSPNLIYSSASTPYTLSHIPSPSLPFTTMPPTIILIRHAEAQHNLTKDYTLRDPPLTEKGLQQCKSLATSLSARFSNINSKDVAIIVSPMQRTLQTAQLALDWLVDQSVKIVADADWQGKFSLS